MNDYRETEHGRLLCGIQERKNEFLKEFRKEHPRACDIHAYISVNDDKYKGQFIKVYNGKCAYCGVSNLSIPKEMFEIDHFCPKEMSRFKTKAEAGQIENLVLACHTCNHNKHDFEVPDAQHDNLHPDLEGIKDAFYRDELFYIRVSEGQPRVTEQFYEQLRLGRETARIDYLLMSMRDLFERIESKPEIHDMLGSAIMLLQSKRNCAV